MSVSRGTSDIKFVPYIATGDGGFAARDGQWVGLVAPPAAIRDVDRDGFPDLLGLDRTRTHTVLEVRELDSGRFGLTACAPASRSRRASIASARSSSVR